MHGKEFILDCIRTFFTIVTLINVVIFALGMYFLPENRFGYEAFIVPVVYGLAGTLPNLVLYSKRELKVRELLVRKVLQLILIEVLVLYLIFGNTAESVRSPQMLFGTALGILLIYVVATLFDWLQNYLSAKQMTEELIRFQSNVQD